MAPAVAEKIEIEKPQNAAEPGSRDQDREQEKNRNGL
jgi:hypothetical protein